MKRILIYCTALLAWPTLAQEAPPSDKPGDEERSIHQEVLVERVVWPIFLQPKSCRSIKQDQLVVTEDGESCRITAIEREPPPRVHAILIDNSGSMVPYLERLERAAVDYINSCPTDEPVIITSFANNVVLEAGLSTDRKGQIAAMGDLEPGNRTALLDALYYMLRYLEPRPERQVVILFTDTYDNVSLGRHSAEPLLELARGMPRLSLFVIHLTGWTSQHASSGLLLRQLAAETGGRYYEITSNDYFGKVFRSIRHRLNSEIFLTYSPPPFGLGALDGIEDAEYRLRVVQVGARPGSACRVISAGPQLRLAGRRADTSQALQSKPRAPGETLPEEVLHAGCPRDSGDWQLVERLVFPSPPTWPEQERGESAFYVVDPPTRLFGRALDILTERGTCYDPCVLEVENRYWPRKQGEPRFANRGFSVELPPIEQVTRAIRSPADLLFYLMESHACAAPHDDSSVSARPPLFVHGQTWLELRRHLASAIYRSRDDYRDWANARLERDRREKIDALLTAYGRQDELAPEETARLRSALLEDAPRPGADEAHGILAEWLSDVPAAAWVRQFQTRFANRILRAEAGDREEELSQLTELQSFWPTLLSWFPLTADIRVITPLVPAYDEGRDVIGFYRIVLPRFRGAGPPFDPIPERPFGAEILDLLLGDAELATDLHQAATVTRTDCGPVRLPRHASVRSSPAEPQPGLSIGHAPHEAYETTLSFSAGPRNRFSVTGIHARTSPTGDDFELLCLRVREEKAPRKTDPDLVDRIAERIDEWNLSCGRKKSSAVQPPP
jgi:hypothetical protein